MIDVETIHQLHSYGFKTISPEGVDAPPIEGRVEASLGAAKTAVLYLTGKNPSTDNVLLFAAFLATRLTKNHCYVDGNKRVAWLVLIELLAAELDLQIEATTAEAYRIMTEVTKGDGSHEPLLNWLMENGRLVSRR